MLFELHENSYTTNLYEKQYVLIFYDLKKYCKCCKKKTKKPYEKNLHSF